MSEIKPAYKSQTIWMGILTFVASTSVLLTKPDLYSKLGKCATTFDQAGVAKLMSDVVPILTAFGGIGTVASRFKTGGIYTPRGILGPNREDLQQEEFARVEQVGLLKEVRQILSLPPATSPALQSFADVNIAALAEEFDAK